MNGSKRNTAVVSRDYSHAPEECARALVFLLRKPVSKMAEGPAPEPDGPDEAKAKEGSADEHILPH